jgi:hypothetical protein
MTTTRLLRSPRLAALIAAAVLIATSLGCGYHLTSKGSNLPSHIKTIGVPEFQNATTRPELGERITENLREALIARGRYTIVPDARGQNVDAVLRGTVLSWTAKPVQLGEDDSDAEFVSVTLEASVVFEDKEIGRITWQQDDYKFTSEYRVVGDPDEYFDTELDAVEEVAEDFARAVISAILQGF